MLTINVSIYGMDCSYESFSTNMSYKIHNTKISRSIKYYTICTYGGKFSREKTFFCGLLGSEQNAKSILLVGVACLKFLWRTLSRVALKLQNL